MGNRSFRVRVDGWSNARFVKIEGNLILFEVMWLGCACSTCQNRLLAVTNRLQKTTASWQMQRVQIPERETAPSIVLAVEPTVMPAKVTDYLSELTGLKISEIS